MQTITWATDESSSWTDDDGNLIDTSTNRIGTSIYLFEDNQVVDIQNEKTTIKDANNNPILIISDVNSNNATLHKNITSPQDYFGYKYSYNEADGWVAIEGWIDPRLEENNGE